MMVKSGVGATWASGIGDVEVIAFAAFRLCTGEMEAGIANAIGGNASFYSTTAVDLPTIKPNIEAYAPRNSESGGYVVICWRHTVNLKQTKLKQTLGVSLCQLRHRRC
jgi:hypothetical protein